MSGIFKPARRLLSRCLLPVIERAASAYVAGPSVNDALRVAHRIQSQGRQFTIGYWDAPSDSPDRIVEEYIAGIHATAGTPGSYVSIKVPSFHFDTQLLAQVVAEARRSAVRIHFDSHSHEEATATRTLCESVLDTGVEISYTLPGRWRRSMADAEWIIERQLPVRVVKGQWADPNDPGRNLRDGYLAVIDALAGKARHVEVATHDATLVREAIGRLRAAGTSCQMELLYGLPTYESLALARELNVPVRIYIPYGKAYLPYALSRMKSNPKVAWWMIRDLSASFLRRRSNQPEPHPLATA